MDTEMSGLRERVLPNVSSKNGDLEDKSLDVDARTMAILGKRQQLNVLALLQCSARLNLQNLTIYSGILASFH